MKKAIITTIMAFMLAVPTFLNAQIVNDRSFTTHNPATEVLSENLFFETGGCSYSESSKTIIMFIT
jgi:hypothetical protein